MSAELQHIINDLAEANTLVAHTVNELHAKVSALVDKVEDQFKSDVADVLEMVSTIRTAAHSTVTLASLPAATATPAPVLNPPVDLAQLAADASAAEDLANGVAPAAPAAEVDPTLTDVAPGAAEIATTSDVATPAAETDTPPAENNEAANDDAPKVRTRR